MSLASRHTNATTNDAAPSNNTTTTQINPTSHSNVNQPNNKGAPGSLMNIFGGGLPFPRRMNIQARGAQDNQLVTINLNFVGAIGQGTFGQIERANLYMVDPDNSSRLLSENPSLCVAVKRVLQDPRYKNRELGIMQRLNNHPNIVKFYFYYYTSSAANSRTRKSSSNGRAGSNSSNVDVYLHLVLECFPECLCELIYRYVQRNAKIPVHHVKVFTYQMLKALAYLHSNNICHRDIKSSNLLVCERTMVLKVCDFGSAKEMVPGSANVSYISSRYYRAPELLFGAEHYTCAIDTWSAGCVLAEMLLHHCLFTGVDSVDQLVKVIRVLGTPTAQDIDSMNPVYVTYTFPDVQPCPIKLYFPHHAPANLLAFMCKMLVYNPTKRLPPADALSDTCFDELRSPPTGGTGNSQRVQPANLFDPNPPPVTTVSTPSSGGGRVGATNRSSAGAGGDKDENNSSSKPTSTPTNNATETGSSSSSSKTPAVPSRSGCPNGS